jgi:hypothetical protein
VRCRNCCERGYTEWPEPIRSAGHVRILSPAEYRAWRADVLCPADPQMIWTLSPLLTAVEVGIYSLEHSLCLGSRWKLDYQDACPEILAEYHAKHDEWNEYMQIVEWHETACFHMVQLFGCRPHMAVTRIKAREIAHAIRAQKLAKAALKEINDGL